MSFGCQYREPNPVCSWVREQVVGSSRPENTRCGTGTMLGVRLLCPYVPSAPSRSYFGRARLEVAHNSGATEKTGEDRLAEARLKWRKIQTAAAVRDCPDAALRVLVDELGMPSPVGWECPPGKKSKIVRG